MQRAVVTLDVPKPCQATRQSARYRIKAAINFLRLNKLNHYFQTSLTLQAIPVPIIHWVWRHIALSSHHLLVSTTSITLLTFLHHTVSQGSHPGDFTHVEAPNTTGSATRFLKCQGTYEQEDQLPLAESLMRQVRTRSHSLLCHLSRQDRRGSA